ncbi:GNAT family N-acetyltransferase [Tenuifilum thalassicum]|uniref:GNAT family N-acetyltransferase n=1 Tax=Tenuifilum thalassicum TaxID=2590900 RepID=A0A7D4BER4_9BACT|nr:N-acetyltransferase [Tenuifilum thalassicum]QKG80158.1 GNAT family N-acetyltransferase [Tenuifilum thalassicum]
MENITIRDFTPNDFEELNEVWQLTDLGNSKRGDNLEIIMQSIKMGGKLLVAVTQENRVIGTSWMTFDGRRIHLHHVGVHPQYQGKGIGKRLTIESLIYVKEKGYQVKLEVHKNNTRAINLYKQFGFQYLGDYDVYIIRDLQSINT